MLKKSSVTPTFFLYKDNDISSNLNYYTTWYSLLAQTDSSYTYESVCICWWYILYYSHKHTRLRIVFLVYFNTISDIVFSVLLYEYLKPSNTSGGCKIFLFRILLRASEEEYKRLAIHGNGGPDEYQIHWSFFAQDKFYYLKLIPDLYVLLL